jgi:hypothetical protein
MPPATALLLVLLGRVFGVVVWLHWQGSKMRAAQVAHRVRSSRW